MIDVNQPVTNPELVEIMNQFANERTAANELVLIERITQAQFLAPIVLEGEIVDGTIKAGSTISFKMITNSAAESFFIVFTDWDELAKWSTQKEQTLVSTYEDLKSMVLDADGKVQGFVINPYGQNIVITPELMQYFARKKSEVVIDEETSIKFGQPANYPHEMVKALSKFFKDRKEVESAYLFLAQRGEEKPNLLMIIDFQGEKAALFPRVAAVAQDYLDPDEYIDLMPLRTQFGREATENATPFYKKKKGLF